VSAFVIDASVAAAWFLDDERNVVANELQDRSLSDGVVAPFIWPGEMANLLLVAERRGRIRPEQRLRALSVLRATAAEIDSAEQATFCAASTVLAARRGLSVYDALYLELALRRGLPLATFDNRLAEAARLEGVVIL
jgi:predicted nucleic acid-binding protein